MAPRRSPADQVRSGNPWYSDDQFRKQYDRPGPRAVIEGRWRIFENVLAEFFQENAPTNESPVPARILDAGCGDGINLFGLSNMVQSNRWNAAIYGVDYNDLRVGRASRLPLVTDVRVSSLEALPYPDAWFSVVLCNQVLEHITEDEKALHELRRVIRPGGILVLGVPNEGCAMGWLRNHVIQRSILRTTDHVNFYTLDRLKARLLASAFNVKNVFKRGFLLPNTILHYAASYFATGRWIMQRMGEVLPSQCAELIVIATPREMADGRKQIHLS